MYKYNKMWRKGAETAEKPSYPKNLQHRVHAVVISACVPLLIKSNKRRAKDYKTRILRTRIAAVIASRECQKVILSDLARRPSIRSSNPSSGRGRRGRATLTVG